MKTLIIALVILIILLIISIVYGVRAHISINKITKAWATAEKERLSVERELNAIRRADLFINITNAEILTFYTGVVSNCSENDKLLYIYRAVGELIAMKLLDNPNYTKITYEETPYREQAKVEIRIIPYKENE